MRATVDILTSPGCAACTDFLRFWNDEKASWPDVVLRETSLLSDDGQRLAVEHGVLSLPGIILDGSLIAMGGFSPESIRQHLRPFMSPLSS